MSSVGGDLARHGRAQHGLKALRVCVRDAARAARVIGSHSPPQGHSTSLSAARSPMGAGTSRLCTVLSVHTLDPNMRGC